MARSIFDLSGFKGLKFLLLYVSMNFAEFQVMASYVVSYTF